MKLIIITAVDEYKKEVVKLFKQAHIENFSNSDIEGFKTTVSDKIASNWFGSNSGGADSKMFFSFDKEEKIEALFKLITTYNEKLESNNPIRAIVVPIEKYI